ncbi:hypothetical protein HispidOSU_004002 [Sigmodon hispidus]
MEGNRGGCAAEKLPVPRAPLTTRASPQALSASPCRILKLSFLPAPPPSRPPTPSPFKPHCHSPALPSVLIGETPPRRGWRAPPEQPRPPAPPRSPETSAQSSKTAGAVGGPRVSCCGKREPRHLPPLHLPARQERPGADTSRVRPAEPGPSGAPALRADTCPSRPLNPGYCSRWQPRRLSRTRQRPGTRAWSTMAAKLLLLLCLFSGLHAR